MSLVSVLRQPKQTNLFVFGASLVDIYMLTETNQDRKTKSTLSQQYVQSTEMEVPETLGDTLIAKVREEA